jgi:hypothetical protein
MPQPGPYESINISPGVRNTNPVGSWSQLHPSTQKYLVDNFGVDQKGTNWMQQPANLREAVNRYPLPAVKQMAAQGRLKPTVDPRATAASTNVGSFVGNMLGASTGGLSGLPLTSMSGTEIKPVQGGATVDLNKGTITRTGGQPQMGTTTAQPGFSRKQGSAMDDKQMFKAAFLAKCVEDGLSIDQIAERVKTALHTAKAKSFYEKRSGIVGEAADAAANVLKTLAKGYGLAGLASIGIPTAAGYYGLGPLIHNVTKPNLPNRDEILKEELTREYERQADMLKKNTELAKRRKERSKNISGITRY